MAECIRGMRVTDRVEYCEFCHSPDREKHGKEWTIRCCDDVCINKQLHDRSQQHRKTIPKACVPGTGHTLGQQMTRSLLFFNSAVHMLRLDSRFAPKSWRQCRYEMPQNGNGTRTNRGEEVNKHLWTSPYESGPPNCGTTFTHYWQPINRFCPRTGGSTPRRTSK